MRVNAGYTQAAIVVTTSAGSSDAAQVQVYRASPGSFTMNGTGCGQVMALNIGDDGTVTINSPSNSAAPGDFIAVFGTGLGVPVYTICTSPGFSPLRGSIQINDHQRREDRVRCCRRGDAGEDGDHPDWR
jgi:uncharacterized protein (TIGR03437 family)